MKAKTFLVLGLLMALILPISAAIGQTPQVQTPYVGIWLSASELEQLPVTGAEWNKVLAAANASPGTPNLKDQDSNHDQYILAKALVYARTGTVQYREEVITALKAIPNTENGGRTLALGRNLAAYVIAADLVNLPLNDPDYNVTFKAWLAGVRSETLDGRTLVSTHEDRPNNWGTHAGASLAAVAVYLDDEAALDRVAQVFQGWAGDRAAYNSFSYGELDWQCNPSQPVGINPDGCTVQGVDVGGSQPEEMRRAGAFSNPPAETGYAWEALQGSIVQAYILHRQEYPVLAGSDQALLRAVQYLDRIGWEPIDDDAWQPYLINFMYNTNFPVNAAQADHGKNMGWTSWTHGEREALPPSGTVTPTLVGPTNTPTVPPTATATIDPGPTSTELPAITNTPVVPPTATAVVTDPPTATPTTEVTAEPPTATPTVEPTSSTQEPPAVCIMLVMTDPITFRPCFTPLP